MSRRFDFRTLAVAGALAAVLAAPIAAADSISIGPEILAPTSTESLPLPVMRLAESLSIEPARRMVAAEEGARDQLEALREWNRSGKLPTRVAIHRQVASPLAPRILAADWSLRGSKAHDGGWLASSPRGALVWGAAIEVPEARALRVRLDEVRLPEGTRLWVYGTFDQAYYFDLSHRTSEGSVWSPMVLGDRIHLEVEVPDAYRGTAFSFDLGEVSEYLVAPAGALPSFGGAAAAPESGAENCLAFGSCFDAADYPGIEAARGYVVQQFFEDGGGGYICSGGLLNDFDPATQKPWMLTAAHCYDGLNIADVESSIDPWYRYVATGCPPTGSTLLQGPIGGDVVVVRPAPDPDVALVLMNSTGIPAGLVLGGWSTAHVGNNEVLHRISHPYACIPGLSCGAGDEIILPQMYSRHTTDTTPTYDCTAVGIGQAEFIYSTTTLGTTAGGSSGSPVARSDGTIVGQLLGKCQAGNTDDCAYSMFNMLDGRLEASYSFLAPYLNPSAGGPCVPSATVACLGSGGRFKVEGFAFDFQTPPNQYAMTIAQVNGGENLSDDSAVFWFFEADNWELLIKVIDACSPPFNAYWVYYAATTNVEFHVTVTDTLSGLSKTYDSVAGPPAPAVTDTNAFATCP
ncbi:MAG: hypothetical protein KDB94_02445 [Acidobacteria bacterium]|nr:hypothetical protein [Acidobacteriota bacterium]